MDLEHQIQVLKRCLFGSRSEKISPDELEALITEAAQEATDEILKAKRPDQPPAEAEEEQPETSESLPRGQRKARPHGRNHLPEHLPRRRIEHPIDPAQTRCPHCLGNPLLVKIGEDIREKLAKLPVQYEVQQHVYPKCVCKKCHRGVVMPEAPDDSLKADITVVADMVVQNDTFRSRVEGVIYGATLVSITPSGDDTYETTLSLDKAVVQDLRMLYLGQLTAKAK